VVDHNSMNTQPKVTKIVTFFEVDHNTMDTRPKITDIVKIPHVAHGNGNEYFHGCRGQVSMPADSRFEDVQNRACDLGAKYIVKPRSMGPSRPGAYYIKCIPTHPHTIPGVKQITSEEIETHLYVCIKNGIKKGSTSWVLYYK
jgi:hypothetical protein